MKLGQTFWAFARRYNGRRLNAIYETTAFAFGGLWLLIYVAGFLAAPRYTLGYLPFGFVSIVLPITFAVLHRRIRLESLKGRDALYQKWLAASRQ